MKAVLAGCLLLSIPAFAQQEDMGQRGVLRLSLKRAIEIAVSPEGNAKVELAQAAANQAAARSGQARAALLPDFEATAGMQNVVRSLAQQGFNHIANPIARAIPDRVGPFNIMDARASVTQNVLELSALRRYQASAVAVKAAKTDVESVDDVVAGDVARAYLAALRDDAELEAVDANIKLAEAVVALAQRQKDAGTGTAIEVTRARVQLSNEKQRRLVARTQRHKAVLQLLRSMGAGLDMQVELTDKLIYLPTDVMTLQQAKEEAFKTRADLRTQQHRKAAAKLNHSASSLERLPSLAAGFDYGTIGWYDNKVLPTRTFAVGLKIPIFDGGRRNARRAETGALLRQEQVILEELKDQIELEVRLSLDALQSAEEQVSVAREGMELAESELAQAQRRYEAGAANGIEVTDAQTRVERARDNQIAALFNYNLARIDLGRATGDTRRMLPVKE